MSNNKSVALLITCHNRRDETIASLKALYHCITLENHTFDVFLQKMVLQTEHLKLLKNYFSNYILFKIMELYIGIKQCD